MEATPGPLRRCHHVRPAKSERLVGRRRRHVFIDDNAHPAITGTGSEDYFLGAYDFGEQSFSYRLFGAPVKGEERAGGRSYGLPMSSFARPSCTNPSGPPSRGTPPSSDNFYSVAAAACAFFAFYGGAKRR